MAGMVANYCMLLETPAPLSYCAHVVQLQRVKKKRDVMSPPGGVLESKDFLHSLDCSNLLFPRGRCCIHLIRQAVLTPTK